MVKGTQTPRDQLDRLLALVRRSFRFAWIAALIGALGTAATVAFALTRQRTYESRTVILHREVIPAELLQGGAGIGAAHNLDSRFREMVLASPLLEKVIREYDLYPELIAEKGLAAAVEEMRIAVKFGSRGAGTFNISYRGRTPVEAQRVTARLADLLIEWEVEFQLDSVSSTKDFLGKERDRAEAELTAKQRELARFLSAHPEFAQESADVLSGRAGIAVKRASRQGRGDDAAAGGSQDPRVVALGRQRDRMRARLDDKPAPGPSAAELRTPEAQRAAQRVEIARAEVQSAQSAVDEIKLAYTEAHPDVRASRQRLDLANRRLVTAQAELSAAAGRPPAIADRPITPEERASLEAELAQLNRDITAAKRRASDDADEKDKPTATLEPGDEDNWVVRLETEWAQLFRELEEARERYGALDAKAFTAEIVAASEAAGKGSQLKVVDPAFLPTRPAGAPRSLMALAGVVVFGGLGAVVAVGLALVDDRIISPYDVDKLEVAPFLVGIPRGPKSLRGKRGARGA